MPFDIALTGLNAASSDLEVTANNIANSNTNAFKRSRAEFADIYSIGNLGTSRNQIGQGVSVSSVSQQFSQGDITFSDNNLDLAISGKGFFRLNDGGVSLYTRAGAFRIERNGYVVNASQQRLTGYLADNNGNITGAIGDLQISSADQPPQATTSIDVGANLNASDAIPLAFSVLPTGPDPSTFNNSTSLTIHDSLGASHIGTLYFRKNTVNEWETFLFVDGVQVDGPDLLQFNPDGSLNTINGVATNTVTAPAFNPGSGASNMTVTVDYADITQYGSAFGVNALTQNGYPTGRLSAVDIDETGVLFARFSNGQSRPLAQVALANFANVQGLRQMGDTAWSESFSSGAALVGVPGSADIGLIQSGALEESNVDLTAELVRMITAQRNFQASAEVISTADSITQSIINIR